LKLYYYRGRNFGDALNPWLWPKFIPDLLDENDEQTTFVGIGTILDQKIPERARTFVFGSGFGGRKRPSITESWQFFCVRGPLTARALGLDPSVAVTDPAALLYALDLPRERKAHEASFMPHYRSEMRYPWRLIAQRAGMHYISPSAPVDTVLRELGRTKCLITEAMHGAIVADVLRVPWIAVSAYSHINEFKWNDWCASLGLTYEAHRLRPLRSPSWALSRLQGPLPDSRVSTGMCRLLLSSLGPLNRVSAAVNVRRLRDIAERVEPRLSDKSRLSEASFELQRRLTEVRNARV